MTIGPVDAGGQIDFINWRLDFCPSISARYERDTGAERVIHLRRTILLGLIFYNVYNLTDVILLPDTLTTGLALRLGVVTSGSFCLSWAMPRFAARPREGLITAAMIIALAVPIYLLWLTKAPLGDYSVAELPLTEVFGGMMLLLRFPCTIIFLACGFAMEVLAFSLKSSLSHSLWLAFSVQSGTSAAFVLYSNYATERARRGAYLFAVRESLRSERLETDRKHFSEISSIDALTGLGNRRVFDATLAGWTSDAVAPPFSHSVIMIDVDHFKAFNDTYGHQSGDKCLRQVADAISGAVRTGDVVVRYGGEEFAALLTGCDSEMAERIAARVCHDVAALSISHRSRPDCIGVVTVSAGVAHGVVRQPSNSFSLVAGADEALYRAKTAGRNRVRIHFEADVM